MTARKLITTFTVWRALSIPVWSLSKLSLVPVPLIGPAETVLSSFAPGIFATPANVSGERLQKIPKERRM